MCLLLVRVLYKGCYLDTSDRAVPTRINDGDLPEGDELFDRCHEYARDNGYPLFSLQVASDPSDPDPTGGVSFPTRLVHFGLFYQTCYY